MSISKEVKVQVSLLTKVQNSLSEKYWYIHTFYRNLLILIFDNWFSFEDASEALPAFEILSKGTNVCDTDADLCIKVTFVDNSKDYISAKASPRARTVLKGRLQSNGRKAVIIRSDKDNGEDTVNIIWFCRGYTHHYDQFLPIKITWESFIFRL